MNKESDKAKRSNAYKSEIQKNWFQKHLYENKFKTLSAIHRFIA